VSFVKRMFSSIGIGNAKVDTVLTRNQFAPGDVIEATVHIKGGKVDQRIEEIYFSLHCNYLEEDDDRVRERTAVLEHYKLGESLVVLPGTVEQIPVDLTLPFDVPLSLGKTQVWIQTGLDIKQGVDPSDRDPIEIVPDRFLEAFLRTIEDMGFRLHSAECEKVSRSFGNRLPFVQEMEFFPEYGDFHGRVKELEIVYHHHGDHLELWLEIDRRTRGFSGFMSEVIGSDESRMRLDVYDEDLTNLPNMIYGLLDQYS